MENRTGIEGEDEMLAGFCKSPPASSRRWLLQPKPLHVAHRVAEVAGMFLFSLYLNPVQCSTVRSPVRFETLVSKVLRIDDDCHVYIRICLVVINMYGTFQRYIVVPQNWNSAFGSGLFRSLRSLPLLPLPPLPPLLSAPFAPGAEGAAHNHMLISAPKIHFLLC